MTEMPPRIARLARDHRGFPVPWFVQWFDDSKPCEYGRGAPDFRIIDPDKFVQAVKQRRCWVCGDRLGQHLAFAIGPMCAVNRVTSEPPAHRDCALYSLAACPFLSRPRMRRNEKDMPVHVPAPGYHLEHNPGALCLWTTHDYKPFRADGGEPGVLLQIGKPERVEWFCEGRTATREEVQAAIDKGLPSLRALAMQDGHEAVKAMEMQLAAALRYLPPPG